MMAIFQRGPWADDAASSSSIRVRKSSSSAMSGSDADGGGGRALRGRLLPRGDQRKADPERRPGSRHRGQDYPPPEAPRHDIIDDMEAEPGSAITPTGGEERVEGLALHLLLHPRSIVAEDDVDLIRAAGAGDDADRAARVAWEGVRDRVEEQV